MKEQDNIEDLFKSAFDDFTVAPPAAVKESIDVTIAAYRKKKFMRWFSAGVIVFVLLFVAGVSLLDNERHEKRLAQQEAAASGTQQKTPGSATKVSSVPDGQKNTDVSFGDSAQGTKKSALPSANDPVDRPGKSSVGKNRSASAERQASESNSGKENSSKTRVRTKRTVAGKAAGFSSKSSGGIPASGAKGKKRGKRKTKAPVSGKQAAGGNYFEKQVAADGPAKGVSSQSAGQQGTDVSVNNPSKTGNPETTLQENKTVPVAADSAQLEPGDSSTTEVIPEPVKQKKKLENALLLSLRGGPEFGFSKFRNTDTINRSLSEKSGFFIQAEATYLLGQKWGLTSGLNYDHRIENLSGPGYKDSIVYSTQMEYVYDTAQVVIDSFLVVTDTTVLVPATLQNSYRIYAFSLPVMFAYSLELSPNLNLDLNAGAILSLQGSKLTTAGFNQEMTVNKLGVKACVRAQLRYQFSQWGVSLNTNFGYDLVPVNAWQGTTRSRTYFNAGIGVHYLLSK